MISKSRLGFVLAIVVVFFAGIFLGNFNKQNLPILWPSNNEDIVYATINEWDSERFSNVSSLKKISLNADENTGIFLTYGQSNSANHGRVNVDYYPNVYQFFLGEVYEYKNPSLGATGVDDSVWGLVGNKLITQNIYTKVIFANTGWGGMSISQLKEGHYFNFFINTYKDLFNRFGRVDAILFHQGESDNYPDRVDLYYDNFIKFVRSIEDKGIEVPIYLSQASYCTSDFPVNEVLTNSQRKLVIDNDIILQGPNTDLLVDTEFRFDQCHFSEKGNEKFANMWVESIKSNISN